MPCIGCLSESVSDPLQLNIRTCFAPSFPQSVVIEEKKTDLFTYYTGSYPVTIPLHIMLAFFVMQPSSREGKSTTEKG